MKSVGEILSDTGIEVVSKRQTKKAEAIEMVIAKRKDSKQDIGFNSRHFVLCCLPFKPINALKYERRNGTVSLQIVGHPDHGVPYGQDRLWLIWLATEVVRQKSRTVEFKHARQILDTFDIAATGLGYKRLKEGLQRIFASTIFFGSEDQKSGELILDWKRYHYLDEMQLWFRRPEAQEPLPGQQFLNRIEVSEYFYSELMTHPVPVDLAVVRALADSPGALDFYTWLVWRCWRLSPGQNAKIPLSGPWGLDSQMGVTPYSESRRWKAKIHEWLRKTKALWPECPVEVSGEFLTLRSGQAILAGEQELGR